MLSRRFNWAPRVGFASPPTNSCRLVIAPGMDCSSIFLNLTYSTKVGETALTPLLSQSEHELNERAYDTITNAGSLVKLSLV